MKESIYVICISIVFNLLVFGAIFHLCRKAGQTNTIYFVYLIIQALIFIWCVLATITTKSEMGSGLVIFIGFLLQAGIALLAFATFGIRQASGSGLVSGGVIALLIAAVYVLLFVDHRAVFLTMTSGENMTEEEVANQNKPFSGTAYYRGLIEGNIMSNNEYGLKVTQYANGKKEGIEKVYFTGDGSILTGKRTRLQTITHYSNGEKHGTETVSYHSGGVAIEANYANGKLHGLYRKFDYPNRDFPLRKEIQYAAGEINGFFRTYDSDGSAIDDYTAANGSIINGWRWIEIAGDRDKCKLYHDNVLIDEYTPKDSITYGMRWLANENREARHIKEYYKDGQLTEQTSYDFSGQIKYRQKKLNTLLYENGEISDIYYLDGDYQNDGGYNSCIRIHKKRINGEFIVVFHQNKGIDRYKEFGLE